METHETLKHCAATARQHITERLVDLDFAELTHLQNEILKMRFAKFRETNKKNGNFLLTPAKPRV